MRDRLSPLSRGGYPSTGAPASFDSHFSCRLLKVPSWSSAVTAAFTHAVTGLPLAMTRPKCSVVPSGGGSCPTMTEFGTWAAGGDVSACSECGEGYNTTADGSVPTTSAVAGASAASQCAISAGWSYADIADAAKGLAPCVRGTYKALIGNASCTTCPAGTTTTITMAATAQSDCDSCRPGFGTASINLANPSCAMCTSGAYSAGYNKGGQSCVACPKPELFSGTMVSRNVSAWLNKGAPPALLASAVVQPCCLPPSPDPDPSPPRTAFHLLRASSPPRTAWASL